MGGIVVSRDEINLRIARLQALIKEQGLAGAFFLLAIDVYYYSGTSQNAALWVPTNGAPMLLVRKSLARARAESLIPDVRPFPASKEFAGLFDESIRRVGMTFDVLPVQQLNYYTKLLPGREFVDVSMLNRELRSVKSDYELDRMRRCGRTVCQILSQVPRFLKAGMREIDLAAEIEYRLRKAGNEGFIRMRAFNQSIFMGLAVSSGAVAHGGFDGAVTGRGLSPAAPGGSSREPIRVNEPVLLDYTGVFDGYLTDISRILVVGELDPELRRAFEVSLAIQSFLQNALRPGAICEELYRAATEMAVQAGLDQYFMGMPGEQSRFVGHGVGLELDEFPILAPGFKARLQAGQTLAIEPKFIIPGKGVIGIENTFAVSAAGGEKLTDMPDEIMVV